MSFTYIINVFFTLRLSHHLLLYFVLIYLAQRDFPDNCVHGEPLIHLGCSRSDADIRQGGSGLDTQDDVLIQGIWEIQNDAIINIIFGNSDTDIYRK